MSKHNSDNVISITDEVKSQNSKFNLNKFEFDLYQEERSIPQKLLRVKRTALPNKGEKWKIFEDSKAVFTVDGSKLTNKEKEFLRSVEGVNFLLEQYKQGIKSFNALKQEIKKKINKA